MSRRKAKHRFGVPTRQGGAAQHASPIGCRFRRGLTHDELADSIKAHEKMAAIFWHPPAGDLDRPRLFAVNSAAFQRKLNDGAQYKSATELHEAIAWLQPPFPATYVGLCPISAVTYPQELSDWRAQMFAELAEMRRAEKREPLPWVPPDHDFRVAACMHAVHGGIWESVVLLYVPQTAGYVPVEKGARAFPVRVGIVEVDLADGLSECFPVLGGVVTRVAHALLFSAFDEKPALNCEALRGRKPAVYDTACAPPPNLYPIRAKVSTQHEPHAGQEPPVHRALSHRFDRRGHEVCFIRRGALPLSATLRRTLLLRGYTIYSEGLPSEEDGARLARRGLAPKSTDEWLAVLTFWRKETIVGPPELPYVPAVRTVF